MDLISILDLWSVTLVLGVGTLVLRSADRFMTVNVWGAKLFYNLPNGLKVMERTRMWTVGQTIRRKDGRRPFL